MKNLLTDLRYQWRASRRSLAATLAVISMLALGTGGVTTVFNHVYSMLFAPLPFPQPEQLVVIGGDIRVHNSLSNRFEREEDLARIFSNLTTYRVSHSVSVTIPDTGKIRQFSVAEIDGNFFETLRVSPLRKSNDFMQGGMGYVVSSRFWRDELMGADDAVGKLIQIEFMGAGMAAPIIGIMPERFDFPIGADIWRYSGLTVGTGGRQYFGRLRPGIPMGYAAEELRAIEFPAGDFGHRATGPLLQPLQTFLYGDQTPILLMLGSAAVIFLLMVCASVMNLLITQGMRRQSEMALRLILGASRRNLIFQLLRETLPLVIVGALAGFWLSEMANTWLMAQFPALKGGDVAVPVKMAFVAAVVFAVTIIGGLTPALYATGVDLNTYLKSGGGVKRRFFSFSMNELLTGMQAGLTLALIIGVGLLVGSMMFHVDVPIRWTSRDMVVVKADFPRLSKQDTSPEAMTGRSLFYQELQHRLSTMPEVAAAGIFNPIPFSASAESARYAYTPVSNASVYSGPERVSVQAIEGRASSEGFEMFGSTLIAGRFFTPTDAVNATELMVRSREASLRSQGSRFVPFVGGVVIVNQSLAQRLWPGEIALGKIVYGTLDNAFEIVGIVRDSYQVSDNKEYIPTIYYPPDNWNQSQTFIVKLHSRDLMSDFRQRLSDFDAGSVTFELQSLGDIVSGAMANTRMTLQLLGIFALLSIVVAGMGVYTTTSLMAAAWTREMGIRIALGAQTFGILRLALWRGTRAILFGFPFGLFLAWILSRTLSSYLFHVKTGDPFVWVISCALLLIITIVAAFIPAFRSTRVNPLDAMRNG